MRASFLLFITFFFALTNFYSQTCLSTNNTANDHIDQTITPRSKIHIPVVVHIIYTDEAQNISDEQVISQINILNQDFNLANPRIANVPDVFKNLAATVELTFCLALKDPDGQPTNGITRRKTQVEAIGLTEKYYQFNQGGQDAWDQSKYLNIWVADFGSSDIQGYGHFPGSLPLAKDGVIVNYKYFGTEGTATIPHHLGSTCTHEIGHFLNLKHIWGDEFDCETDDGIADTPLQAGPTTDCPTFPHPDACTQGNGIMFQNFMDYTDDACMAIFTEGQKTVMLQTLNTTRSELTMNDHLCMVPTIDVKKENVQIYPNPTSALLTIKTDKDLGVVHLLNIEGQKILRFENKTVDISRLASGMYFLKIKNQYYKVIKQ